MRWVSVVMGLLLAGCASGVDEFRLQESRYQQQIAEVEDEAKSGQVKWADAVRRMREIDKQRAADSATIRYFNMNGYYSGPSWVYNEKSEEYFSYCLALAEKVDLGALSFLEFDHLRVRKRNELWGSGPSVVDAAESPLGVRRR